MVSAHLREHALGMLHGGMRTTDAAKAIHCNVRTVRCLRQRYRETGRTAAPPHSGRPRPAMASEEPGSHSIEYVWGLLDRRARAIPPRNVRELAGALVEEWGNISQQKLANLVQSMRRRCTAVLNAAGGHTRY